MVEMFSSNGKISTLNKMVRLALATQRNGSVVDLKAAPIIATCIRVF
jgi:hypothetical protein